MARKKRKDEVEEPKYEFVPPDFDEKAFLEKDIRGTKSLIIATFLGILAGVLAFALTGISVYLGLIVIIACAVGLKYLISLLKIAPDGVDWKTLVGNIAIIFLLSLGIWIVMLNPPFSDQIAPEITANAIYFNSGTGWTKYVSDGTTPIYSGNQVNITVTVRDNDKVNSITINVHLSSQTGTFHSMNATAVKGVYETGSVTYNTGASNSAYIYTINVTDRTGRLTPKSSSFTINPLA
jgi:hypothetical protein